MDVAGLEEILGGRFCDLHPQLAARHLGKRLDEKSTQFLQRLPEPVFARVMAGLDAESGLKTLLALDKAKLNQIIALLPPTEILRMFIGLADDERKIIFERLDEKRLSEVQELIDLPSDCAGILMDRKFIVVRDDECVKDAIEEVQATSEKTYDLYVMNQQGHLVGMVAVQNLLNVMPSEKLVNIISPVKSSVNIFAKSSEIKEIFDNEKVSSIPVIGVNNELLGVIRYEQIVKAVEQDLTRNLMTMTGASPEERALSTPIISVKHRLPWLIINLGTAFLAASIVGVFENTIAQVTALAVLMPVVAGQSGNTGAQAMAVTMRGLALREIRVKNLLALVFKELRVGFMNGIAIAIFTVGALFLWNPDIVLAILLGISMITAMVLASVTGTLIPIILTALKRDPAQSSSIILTTLTDVISFFSFLGLSTLFISKLVA